MNKSPLSKLFSRQQPKVKHSERKAALIKVHANDDLDLFVELIKKWLDEDNQEKPTQKVNK